MFPYFLQVHSYIREVNFCQNFSPVISIVLWSEAQKLNNKQTIDVLPPTQLSVSSWSVQRVLSILLPSFSFQHGTCTIFHIWFYHVHLISTYHESKDDHEISASMKACTTKQMYVYILAKISWSLRWQWTCWSIIEACAEWYVLLAINSFPCKHLHTLTTVTMSSLQHATTYMDLTNSECTGN